jgi:hypothetical protein
MVDTTGRISNLIIYPDSDGQPMTESDQQRDAAQQRAEELAARLRELGIDPG